MEETISLQDIFKTLKKRFKLIALITLIAITISGIISFAFMTPIYEAQTQILVNQEKQEPTAFNVQDIQTNLQLINTYNVIIKSPAILSKVIDQLDLEHTPKTLTENVTVSSEQNSQVINVVVEDPSPKQAVNIANTIGAVFQDEIKTLMKVDNVNILTPAEMQEDPSPVKPNPLLNMAIAAVLGLMVGVGVAFLLEYLDTTVKTEQDIEELLNLPVIGLISPIPDREMPTPATDIKQRRMRG